MGVCYYNYGDKMSILDMISAFAKDQKLTIDGLYYKFDNRFPKAFYDTVVVFLKAARLNYSEELVLDGFYINLTPEKNVTLTFVANDNYTKLVVTQNHIHYENLPAAKIINEQVFLDSISKLDTEKNNLLINALPDEFRNRFLSNIDPKATLENMLLEVAYDIMVYMRYLEDEKALINEKKTEISNTEKSIDKIYFTESESSTNDIRTPSGNTKPTEPRKHGEIDIEHRLELLDAYFPQYEFEAVSNNSNSVYYVKVFRLYPTKYKLIMEPKAGTKYTKIIHLDRDKLSIKEMKEIVVDALQLSRADISGQKNITRHNHTTIEEYNELLDYLIYSHNNDLDYSAKKRIEEAERQSKR